MSDRDDIGQTGASRGCLAAGIGGAALAVLSPFVLVVQGWRRWRRGSEIKKKVHTGALTNAEGTELRRIDLELDVPQPAEPGFRRDLTDTVVRVAETLRALDDVYHLIYRFPWEEEPVLIPVGPNLQELGERFSLVQSQGAMAGRTAVWLALGREHSLSEVVDPVAYDPEGDGEPEGLLTNPALRWSMATEWARLGPSLLIRMIIVVPPRLADRVTKLLDSLA
jgi:hypothetical protein